ncbi:fructosamine kinase family protein [Flavobacteriaceae bacterium D16]|nr:fructosamine kinase family protein [Flavobacteriaceae bacterium D16]
MQAETKHLLEGVLGAPIKSLRSVSGGDIARAYLIETSSNRLFCKMMPGKKGLEMLRAELEGLEQIRETGSIKAPRVYFCERLGEQACLGMEYVESKNPSSEEMRRLGEQLAQMHQSTSSLFGYSSDNFIGSLPQSNKQHSSWVSFYVKQRLLPQFQMALSQNLMHTDEIPNIERMVAALSPFLKEVSPALLHGDLWSGNYLISNSGEPYLIDPAVYYGDPVVDLAMSRLFGGFGAHFYQAYDATAELIEREEDKIQLYQLYYLLVHLNLFGGSYYGGVKRIMDTYF